MNSDHLVLEGLHKNFGETPAVKDVSLNIKKGEFITLLGPSGCGKTTTLHMIAGFHRPDRGEIWLNGKNITDTPVYIRKMPMVFQEYALFPHLNIFENIAFGLKIRKEEKLAVQKKVAAILEQLGLPGVANRLPGQLSGGQQQRIALARALVLEPEVLLLDEPLSNLDAKLRIQIRYEIKQLQNLLNITAVFVTHDQEEALSISDKIAVMNQGIIEQFGTPWEVYYHPKNEFVAGFIGEPNLLDIRIVSIEKSQNQYVVKFRWHDSEYMGTTGQTVLNPNELHKVLLRPETISITPLMAESTDHQLIGKIKRSSFLGTNIRYWLEIGGQELVVDDAKASVHGHLTGEVGLSFSPQALYFL
jgi:ABC-type Fe3+/spermidine/putrescine transport system ATPase subunit